MKRQATVFLLAAAALLVGISGCGTRSILVPVTRPAQIKLHFADTASVIPTAIADAAPLSQLIAIRIDSLLPAMLSTGDQIIHVMPPGEFASPVFQADGSISRRALRWWSSRHGDGVLLGCQLVRSILTEELTNAAIRSTRTPGASKSVRQGRAEAVCRVLLIDLRKEAILFDDTLSVLTTAETHSSDGDPPPIDEAGIADKLALQISTTIMQASHSVHDRDVVTFLTDSDFPEIEAAITFAEEGRWKLASDLLQRLISETEQGGNSDVLWYDLGLTLQYQQNFKGALDAFERAILIRDRSRYRHARATLLLLEEEFLDHLKLPR